MSEPLSVEEATAWLEREKHLNQPPAMRFAALMAVSKAMERERERDAPNDSARTDER